MALGATQFNAPAIVPDFSAGMPMVTPVQVLPAQEAKSPIDTLKEVFFDIRKGINKLVDQSRGLHSLLNDSFIQRNPF